MKLLNRDYKDSPLNKKIRYWYDLKKRINDSGLDAHTKYNVMNYCEKEINRCWRYHYEGYRGYEGGPIRTRGNGFKKITVKDHAKELIDTAIENRTIHNCPFCGWTPLISLDEREMTTAFGDTIPVYRFVLSGGSGNTGKHISSFDVFSVCSCSFEYRSKTFTPNFDFSSVSDIFDRFVVTWNNRG